MEPAVVRGGPDGHRPDATAVRRTPQRTPGRNSSHSSLGSRVGRLPAPRQPCAAMNHLPVTAVTYLTAASRSPRTSGRPPGPADRVTGRGRQIAPRTRRRPGVITGCKAARNRPLTRGQNLPNTPLAAVRTPVEHGCPPQELARPRHGTYRPRLGGCLGPGPAGPHEPRSRPMTDDFHQSHLPATSTSIRMPTRIRPVTSNFGLHTAP